MKENKRYPDHKNLSDQIVDLVNANMEDGKGFACMHAREVLDDIIYDLNQLRDGIATPEEYLKAGLL
jgi:hypothetical protein